MIVLILEIQGNLKKKKIENIEEMTVSFPAFDRRKNIELFSGDIQ